MFIGREKELELIDRKIRSNQFEFGLVYGRRRIGKTKLLEEVVKKHDAIYYVANELGTAYNLSKLSEVVATHYHESFQFDGFESLFSFLAKRSEEKSTILIIDEFTYLMSQDVGLLSVFQNAIDQFLLQSQVTLILSGSHVGMIEEAISYRKPLYGRTTFKMKIEPFDYYDASKFYPNMNAIDKVRLYGVFGGVPFYTSKINEHLSVKENIINLIVEKGAIFEDEITFFLTQEVRSMSTYGRLLDAIASGATKLSEIASKSGSANTGTISKNLDVLMGLGIVEKEYCFEEGSHSKKTIYRIKDPLFHFHYVFIERNKTSKVLMDAERFYENYIEPRFERYVSFKFETICTEYLKRTYQTSIQSIGRYWYNDAKERKQVEIDIMMKERDTYMAFECKWTEQLIDESVYQTLLKRANQFEPVQLGFFSKSGYEESVLMKDGLFIGIDDLYQLNSK